ncbi:MAG: AsmA family protein [Bacteroidetes bacterium]|nr:AsmA family protein [Bacteroidota bacterium]
MWLVIKKTIKYLFILLLILLIAAVSVPFLFKEKIKTAVLKEIDENIYADVNFSELRFSTLKNFPYLTISISDLSIVGVNDFKNDTLAKSKEVSFSINIKSLFKKGGYEIKKIELLNPLIYARILKNGKANYNIVKQSDTSSSKKNKSNFEIDIDKWEITNGRIVYDDNLQKTYIEVGGLYHKGSGDFKSDFSNLDITTKVNDLTLMYGGVKYFDKKLFKADLSMEMNLKEKKFTFRDHTFQLGEFKFGFDGYFQLLNSGYKLDLTFVVKETNFKNLLSILPGIYQKDLSKIKTKGEFLFKGFIKGVYDVKDSITPSYKVDLKVANAMFKYAHLPKAVENINFDLVAENSDGDIEHTSVNLKTFHFEIDHEAVHGSIYTKGVKNLFVNADIKIKANLAQLEKLYPIDSVVIKGNLNSEIKVNGHFNTQLKLFPKVDAILTLENGFVKKIGSTIEMDSIHVNAEVMNNSGKLEDTKVNVKNLVFLLDGEPFVMSGGIADMKDYNYKFKIDGLIDFEKLTKVYPINNTIIKGAADIDINTDGSLTKIENKQFSQLNASGTIEIKKAYYKTLELAFPLQINDALLSFDDDKIILSRFVSEFGKSNISLSGHLFNYMPFLLKPNSPLKGDVTLRCDTIDMNQWFPNSVSAGSSKSAPNDTSKTKASEILVIPPYIDFTIDSDIKQLKFGAMNISNLDGEIKIKNSVCTLNETGFNTMDSKFILSGDYDTRNPNNPIFDLDINIAKLDFNKAYKTFVDPKGTAPAEGNFSTKYSMRGLVGQDFSPILSTLTGSGTIVIDSVKVKGMKIMNTLKNVSKKDEFNNPSLSDVSIETEIKGGKIFMKPFSFQAGKFLTEVDGWQGFDEKMEYFIKLSVLPFKKIKIPISVSGTSDKPIIKMGKGFSNADLEGLK